jgi:FKBP-type peptidyl-prolyl cis-trans isomerase
MKLSPLPLLASAALIVAGGGCSQSKPAAAESSTPIPTPESTATSSMPQSPTEKGAAFLKANATKDGVKSTASGLQYKILQEGSGKSPKASDTVKVHYRGTLLDGTEFDSSYKRGEPIEFPLNRVIPGWTEGVQLAKEGGKIQLFIPSQLAYGSGGTPGGPIGPNETLIFEIELIQVK